MIYIYLCCLKVYNGILIYIYIEIHVYIYIFFLIEAVLCTCYNYMS